MWCCGKIPEKGWDVNQDGQKEQNVWKKLTGETKPQSGHERGLLAQATQKIIMSPYVQKASLVCTNIWGVYTLCSHSGSLWACCCTAAQQKESTYPACFKEKLVGVKQVIWVPEWQKKTHIIRTRGSFVSTPQMWHVHSINDPTGSIRNSRPIIHITGL